MKAAHPPEKASIITHRTWSKAFADMGLGFLGWGSFITALRSHYEADNELPALVIDLSIPKISLAHCFVNLALIAQVAQERQERVLLSGEASADAALERGELYRSFLETGKSCGVGDLFDKRVLENRSTPVGWTCITGRAGTGKTTLLQYIAYRWGLRESLWNNRFEFVFRAKLNLMGQPGFWEGLPRESSDDYLSWLIYKSLSASTQLSFANIRDCLSNRANQVLLLLDGFDEIQALYGEGRDMRVTALIDAALCLPNGVLTSRPNAVPVSFASKFKQRFENLGLTQDNVRQYVINYFNQCAQPQLGEGLLRELSTNLEIMSLAQIPVNIAAICLTWGQETSRAVTVDTAAPKIFTMTLLYQSVVIWLARRYDTRFRLTAEEKVQGINPATMPTTQILERCREELQTLAQLAYDGFINNEIQTLSHALLSKHFPDQSKLHRITAEFGVLRKETVSQTRGEYPRHYFIHLTYQEYFTALYMAQQLSQEPNQNRAEEIARRQSIQEIVQFIVENRDEQRCAVVWIFLAGLVSMSEYIAGADYFWDAFIDLGPNSDDEGVFIGPHSQTKILQHKQRILREALLVHQACLSGILVVPQRLRTLKAQISNIMSWQHARQAKDLLPMWDDGYDDKPRLKRRQHYQQNIQQYQSDSVILGLAVAKPLAVSLLLTMIPFWAEQVAMKRTDLGDTNKDIRKAAADALGQLGASDEASLKALREASRDGDKYVRKAAVLALAQLGASDEVSLNIFHEALRDGDGHAARRTMALSPLGASDEVILKGRGPSFKQSCDVDVRSAAARALGELGASDEVSLKALREALRDTYTDVRLAAARALRQLIAIDEVTLKAFHGALRGRDSDVRSEAARILGQLGASDEVTLKALHEVLRDRNKSVRETAVYALGQIGASDEVTLNALREALRDSEWFVRETAVYALGFLGATDEASLNALRGALRDGKERVRGAAAHALGHLGACDEVSLNALRGALRDGDGSVRKDAARALGQLGASDEVSLNVFCEALRDGHKDYVLSQIGASDEASLRALREALRDSNEDVRKNVVYTLVQIGASDAVLLNVLCEALRDGKEHVRRDTAKSLKHVAPTLDDASTIRSLLEKAADTEERDIETIRVVHIALVRIHPKAYVVLPELLANPATQGFFIMSLWLHSSGVMIDISQKQIIIEGQSFTLSGTPEVLRAFVAQLQAFQTEFIAVTAASSPELPTILQALTQPIDLPIITDVFNDDFLTKDLPEESILHESHIQVRLQAVESKTSELDERVEELAVSGAHTTETVIHVKRIAAKHSDAIEELQEDRKPSVAGLKQFGITAAGAKAGSAVQRDQTSAPSILKTTSTG